MKIKAIFLISAAYLAQVAYSSDIIINNQKDVDAIAIGGTVKINQRIIISKPGTYDFHNTLFYWDGTGVCGSPENQPYVIRISATQVTVKNFGYKNAPDGMHIGTADDGQGYNYGDTLTGIHLDNVIGWACEDAMTTQYGVKDLLITNSEFHGNPNYAQADKILQMNFTDITIQNTDFYDSQVCIMIKGNQTLRVSNSSFTGCERGIVGETQFGILGKIGTGPSVIYSTDNVADMLDFWDFRNFLVANAGNVTVYSDGDTVANGFICKGNNGGACNVVDGTLEEPFNLQDYF